MNILGGALYCCSLVAVLCITVVVLGLAIPVSADE